MWEISIGAIPIMLWLWMTLDDISTLINYGMFHSNNPSSIIRAAGVSKHSNQTKHRAITNTKWPWDTRCGSARQPSGAAPFSDCWERLCQRPSAPQGARWTWNGRFPRADAAGCCLPRPERWEALQTADRIGILLWIVR